MWWVYSQRQRNSASRIRSYARSNGFTIVELLIVIVVIAILAAIVIAAYNAVQAKAAVTRQTADLTSLEKAIMVARDSQSKTLMAITGNTWTAGYCDSTANNPSGTEPKDLPKSHICWQQYYAVIDKIATAAGMNLSSLKAGDARGNPYRLDENEGEAGGCTKDTMAYYTGAGLAATVLYNVPLSGYSGC